MNLSEAVPITMRSGRRAATALCVVLLALSTVADAAEPGLSRLWGRNGELWSPTSRLPDFSYAGYHRGERPLPKLEADVSVRDFGAVGDGEKDDTAAFQKAIAQSSGRTIFVPAGRYRITDFLRIRRSSTCLLGEGPGKSVLFFPVPLHEIKPNMGATTGGRPTSNYSWSGGFIHIVGSPSRKELSGVTQPADRGGQSLVVSAIEGFSVGQDVRLTLRDTDEQTLAEHLYSGSPGDVRNFGSRARVSFAFRITEVDRSESRITFDRPLRTDVRLEWQPRLYDAASSVEEVGVENLGFEFPVTPYGGHFTELGFNAIAISGARNCWIRNIRITHSDSGMFVHGTHITVRAVVITSERPQEKSRKATGHHGITLGGQDNLLDDFRFETRFMHDITVSNGSAGNVAMNGSGIDICLDHHCRAPHANLFTDIDLGEGSRMFQSGGGARLGRHSGAWETFWGIRAERGQKWPAGWGPDLMNFVGVQPGQDSALDPRGRWFEAIDPAGLRPRNLYEAQLERRLSRELPES